jgi:hypothetical protein
MSKYSIAIMMILIIVNKVGKAKQLQVVRHCVENRPSGEKIARLTYTRTMLHVKER